MWHAECWMLNVGSNVGSSVWLNEWTNINRAQSSIIKNQSQLFSIQTTTQQRIQLDKKMMIDGSDDDSAAAVVSHPIDANFDYLSISVMPKLPHVG